VYDIGRKIDEDNMLHIVFIVLVSSENKTISEIWDGERNINSYTGKLKT
jgi:hypothetical protein